MSPVSRVRISHRRPTSPCTSSPPPPDPRRLHVQRSPLNGVLRTDPSAWLASASVSSQRRPAARRRRLVRHAAPRADNARERPPAHAPFLPAASAPRVFSPCRPRVASSTHQRPTAHTRPALSPSPPPGPAPASACPSALRLCHAARNAHIRRPTPNPNDGPDAPPPRPCGARLMMESSDLPRADSARPLGPVLAGSNETSPLVRTASACYPPVAQHAYIKVYVLNEPVRADSTYAPRIHVFRATPARLRPALAPRLSPARRPPTRLDLHTRAPASRRTSTPRTVLPG
ncbi:hypothetical protein HYPSUDRAFT_201448 [Hypholoma sublateritium FD-334 SS-4]|uniref:Uncharacterized protein n=1 Tax=Hypholoma sublateritium (strain FD-334 SS-4) TaxID=945553 RepID=A0A0D2MIE7_HYPSF|nr:hypothetical protein HYPSUDRAFT_201448 [Hypholoma sublateritium FD-334 SS-4]